MCYYMFTHIYTRNHSANTTHPGIVVFAPLSVSARFEHVKRRPPQTPCARSDGPRTAIVMSTMGALCDLEPNGGFPIKVPSARRVRHLGGGAARRCQLRITRLALAVEAYS